MVLQLLPDKLIQLHLLNILLSQLLLLNIFLWVFVSYRVAWNIQIWQEPIIKLLVKYNFLMDKLNVLGRHEIVNNEIL